MVYIRDSRNRFRMFDNGLINPIYQTFSSHIGIEENYKYSLVGMFVFSQRWFSSKVLLPFPLSQVWQHFIFLTAF